MFTPNRTIRDIGDTRTFYKGEKVALNDSYFDTGIYQGSVPNPERIIRTHIITSCRDGTIYPERWVDASNVGKIYVNPSILKKVCLEKLGDPYLTQWILNQGY